MAAGDRSKRNLWIIGALVLATLAVLAWIFGPGDGTVPGTEVADVGVEAAPEPGRDGIRTDNGNAVEIGVREDARGRDGSEVVENLSDALAPPATGG